MLKKQIGYLVLYISGVFFLITATFNIMSYLYLHIFDFLGVGSDIVKSSDSARLVILIRILPDLLLLAASIVIIINCRRISRDLDSGLLERIGRLSVGLLLLVNFSYRFLSTAFTQLSSYFSLGDALSGTSVDIPRILFNTFVVNIPIEVLYLAGAITGIILIVRNLSWIKNSGDNQQWFT